jgi:ubiquinone/menaquinone biosynthesis C-methylase UbiE
MNETRQTQAYYEGVVEPIYRVISGPILHLGMFEGPESRQVATTRTKNYLAARLKVPPQATIVDLGSGYGDAARFLVQRFGCQVIRVNLVHCQNVRARTLTQADKLDGRVSIVESDFARVPLPAGCAQVVWSQESFLHAADRRQVLRESARLLAFGGQLIFTDILQTDPMEPEEARRIYERVQVTSLETFNSYQKHLQQTDLRITEVIDLSRYVAPSYNNHVNSLRDHYETLVEAIGSDYLDYIIQAMERWVQAAEAGKLGWGIFVAQKKPRK